MQKIWHNFFKAYQIWIYRSIFPHWNMLSMCRTLVPGDVQKLRLYIFEIFYPPSSSTKSLHKITLVWPSPPCRNVICERPPPGYISIAPAPDCWLEVLLAAGVGCSGGSCTFLPLVEELIGIGALGWRPPTPVEAATTWTPGVLEVALSLTLVITTEAFTAWTTHTSG